MRHVVIPLLALCASCAPLVGGEAAPPDPAKMQAAMEAMSKTGPEHATLKKMVGTWTTESTMFMPGAPPQKSAGTATVAETLDGKWIRQDVQGTMMGGPFSGLLVSGYDTVQKKYVAVWFDSFSTGLSHMTGESTDGGATITYRSRMDHCPMTGGPLDQRSVVRRVSDERVVMEFFHTPQGGSEMKAMEIVYTRAKAGGAPASK